MTIPTRVSSERARPRENGSDAGPGAGIAIGIGIAPWLATDDLAPWLAMGVTTGSRSRRQCYGNGDPVVPTTAV